MISEIGFFRRSPPGRARFPRAAEALQMADYLRRSPARIGGENHHKEWHHFIVHSEGLHLLVNLNLLDDPWQRDVRRSETVRLIVLAHRNGWSGAVDTFPANEVDISEGGHRVRFPGGECRFAGGRYTLEFATSNGAMSGVLEFEPTSEPALANNQSLSAGKVLRWLFVPRLVCRGRIRIGDASFRISAAPAYHDHNWGYFQWGDDFSWEWGSALPGRQSSPWSVVFMRMADRGRSTTRSQGLYVWRGATPWRIFRDADLRIESEGTADYHRPFKLPAIMSLLSPGGVKDVPERLQIEARGEGDTVSLTFYTDDVCQLVVPNEIDTAGVTILNEAVGRVAIHGRVRGAKMLLEGPGVFEFISH